MHLKIDVRCTIRQARILRYILKRCGGASYDAIRPIGSTDHATWTTELDGPRAAEAMRLLLEPPARWHWINRGLQFTYSRG